MGQFTLFTLFVITLMIGAFAYFFPKQQATSPWQVMSDKSNDGMVGEDITRKSQQLNIITSAGTIQINREIDVLTRQQKSLEDMIKDEQLVLDSTNKEILDISKKANGKTDLDILKLKVLGEELQSEKRLLVEHGQQLLALNNEITKKRKLLAEQRDEVNINTDSTLQSLQGHDASLNDKAELLFDNVKDKNNDSVQHTKELMDEARQKAHDQKYR